MPTVRTTMRPDLEVDVPEADYLDLKRQGLLVETDDPPTPAPAPGPAVTKKAAPPAATKED